jgi:cyanophycinase
VTGGTRGHLVLCGSGEFTTAMDDIDGELLSALRPRARVAIVPTAAGLEDTPKSWIAMGGEHFRSIGAEPVAVPVLTKADASDPRWCEALAEVDWIYFSGGDPGHLVETLEGSPFWSAVAARHREGAILAGSSAGAMMLGETTFVPSDRGPDGFPRSVSTRRAMGLVLGVIVAPHFDILPEPLFSRWAGLVPAGHRLLGIDEDTALIGQDGAWTVRGRGRVHVVRTPTDRDVHPSGASVAGLPLAVLP